jgi:hypothetical protein
MKRSALPFAQAVSLKQSTAQDAPDRPQIRVTHPFHPDRGRSFPFVVAKQLWGEEPGGLD